MAEINRAIPGGPIYWRPIRRIFFFTPTPERARLAAELKQLYDEDKFTDLLARVGARLPKDAAGNFIADQEKSDVVHDLLAHLAEKMLEANMQKQQEIRDPPGWRATWGQRSKTSRRRRSYRATTRTITRASWRSSRRTARSWPSILPAGSPGHWPSSRGTIGKLGPLLERIKKTDRLIDGCAAVRAHRR